MQSVSIVGIGHIPVGEYNARSWSDLAVESLRLAMQDADVQRVQALYIGAQCGAEREGAAAVTLGAGLPGIEALTISAGSASGAAALHVGVLAAAAGAHEVIAVTGVGKVRSGVSASFDMPGAAEESELGLTLDGFYALIMRRYMYEFSWQHADFASIAMCARNNAADNANAVVRQRLSQPEYLHAAVSADPLTVLDIAPCYAGAATVILARTDIADRFPGKAVRITASALASDTLALHDRADVLFPEGAQRSASRAYAQAGRAAQDIDLFELHDDYTIAAALSLEAAGFAAKGDGVRLALDGALERNGRIPICTMGGLLGRGYAPGASGVYQAVDVALQLRGLAGANQVQGARVGMAQSVNGGGAQAVTHIFEV